VIRVLEVPREQWASADITAVRNVLEFLDGYPVTAREWRGTGAITFADAGPEPLLVPEVRGFVRALHDAVPHALYFLSADPKAGSALAYLAAFSRDDVRLEEEHISVAFDADVLARFERTMLDVARYAITMGDDWIAATEGHTRPVDRSMVRRLREAMLQD